MIEFNDVYAQYFQYVYRYVLSLCRNETIAEDITQDAFVKALARIDSFNGNCKIQVWICQIAKNTFLSYCEKTKKYESSFGEQEWDIVEDYEQRFFDKEHIFELHKALHSLSEPYKEVIMLRTFGELSFAQIAELFGKTESWARVTYHRAKIKLKGGLA